MIKMEYFYEVEVDHARGMPGIVVRLYVYRKPRFVWWNPGTWSFKETVLRDFQVVEAAGSIASAVESFKKRGEFIARQSMRSEEHARKIVYGK